MSGLALSHWWCRTSETFVRLVEGVPNVAMLPRDKAHWLTLEVRGVPQRFLASSLRLQLKQFIGVDSFSFAYSVLDGRASIWYWLESDEQALEGGRESDVEPWPESLLRPLVADGGHLIRCRNGVEAIAVRNRVLVRTRWFPAFPSNEQWGAFARDAGLGPSFLFPPSVAECTLLKQPPRNWRLSRRHVRSWDGVAWCGVGLVALLGVAVVAGVTISLKLSSALAVEKASYDKLVKERAVTIALQRDIDEKRAYLSGFSGLRSSYSQLELIGAVIDSGVLSEKAKASLAEWEFKNGRLRLLFSVPQEGFRLGGFLSVLEKQPIFKDLNLMTDTPVGTIGVQLRVASPDVIVANSDERVRGAKASPSVP